MSTDPQGLDSEKPFEPHNYINIKLEKYQWCKYTGECKIDDVLINKHDLLCLHCQHKRFLNIPKMLEEKSKEYEDENNKNNRSS